MTDPAAPTILGPYFESGAFGPTEAHLTSIVARLAPGAAQSSLLALALASRGAHLGHTFIELDADSLFPGPQWPDPDEWLGSLAQSPIVATPADASAEPLRPLVLDGRRVYLQRHWTHEVELASALLRHDQGTNPAGGLNETLDALFPTRDLGDDAQRQATRLALNGGLSIITGGPGTGKTYTIARIITGAHQLAASEGRAFSVALAAPTGKAATRITESLHAAFQSQAESLRSPPEMLESATTIHALLGWAPGDKFRHNRHNPLPHNMVIIDETSMVSLSLMASLLEAVPPDAALVLVGDPDQLVSIDVGTVLSDIIGPMGRSPVGPPAQAPAIDPTASPLVDRITVLSRTHRFGDESKISGLAAAVRAGDIDATLELLSSGGPIEWVQPHDQRRVSHIVNEVVDSSIRVAEAALRGESTSAMSAASSVKVLAATRSGQFGVDHWSNLIESAVVHQVSGVDNSHRWFVGRPVIITANDPLNRVSNGDVGIVVARDNSMAVALPSADGIRHLPTARLAEVETWWAMTIHKSQGSEFDHVVVSLPQRGSPVLSRELLYTGVTRARNRVTILADESSLREAVERSVTRASGLQSRLWGG